MLEPFISVKRCYHENKNSSLNLTTSSKADSFTLISSGSKVNDKTLSFGTGKYDVKLTKI